MKLKSIILTTCLTATALLIPVSLHAQATPLGAPPKFGPEKADKASEKSRGGKWNPEERIARLKEALALTPDQETKIRDILKGEAEKMRAEHQANKGNKPAPEERRAKMQAARQEVQTAIKAVLTPEQQAKFETMKKNRQDRGPKPETGKDIPKP